MELEVIEKGYILSERLGKLLLRGCVDSFKYSYLGKKYGNIIPSMSAEYRTFIIELLKNIDNKFLKPSFEELIFNLKNNEKEIMSEIKKDIDKWRINEENISNIDTYSN